ncbi:amidase [Vitiosangium sp. GDMCC 1.1324]|uniref:amidase n=1 Tax=Vitiosangium sp. (strain GDMCC 1.1324) TaxID=2138576 RepID=UPI000D3474C9|nr:amidase family protein [Vitiosangium sp. GDMCC 1.1324]PTL85987.1 amidase [Vitiosangium sp. GDMCC 1.1324]
MKALVSLARLDGMAQAELCARGEVSAAELFDACMARIEALNPLLRSVVTVERERPRPASSGPFSGVPFLVKDSTPWPGLRWSMGSRLFAANVAQQQTPYGRRLEESGLVCVGKSALSEFGLLGSTETLLEGVTHNPWNLACSATGSSGGSAAAVAAGLVPLAHANDGGGSIRNPASACGLFGFKPSRGRTVPASFASSDFGDMTSDHCISRSVRDSALFLSITEDRSSGAPVGFVREPIARKLRIATWTRTMMGAEPEPAVRRAYDEAVALLTELGHRVEPIAPPGFDAPVLSDAFFLVAGAAIADIVERVDQLRGMPVQNDELEPFTWALVETFLARGPDALPQSRAAFAKAVQTYLETTRGYDVVLTPTIATEPWLIGHLSPILGREELIRRTGRAVGYTPIHNIAGCPGMSVPLHFPKDGLPIGTHFAAAPGADALLFGLAYQLEQARPWKDHWAPYSIPGVSGVGPAPTRHT